VYSGVPQGSVLGPLLFICLLNDICQDFSDQTYRKIFADDQMLFRVLVNSNDVVSLQTDLECLNRNAEKKKLAFNGEKSAHLRLSKKRSPTVLQNPYEIAGRKIPSATSAKYLGVYIDSDLSWKTQGEMVTNKALKRLRYINYVFPCRADNAKIQLYNSLVFPLLDYCCTVIIPCSKFISEFFEAAQKSFVRKLRLGVVFQENTDSHYFQRLAVLDWDPIILHRVKRILIATFRLVNGSLPYGNTVFESLLRTAPENSVAARTREGTRLHEVHPCSLQQKHLDIGGLIIPPSEKSFGSIAATLWNGLALSYEIVNDYSKFCQFLLSFNWRESPLCAKVFSRLTDYFGLLEIREPARR